jgi:hypothetical protein
VDLRQRCRFQEFFATKPPTFAARAGTPSPQFRRIALNRSDSLHRVDINPSDSLSPDFAATKQSPPRVCRKKKQRVLPALFPPKHRTGQGPATPKASYAGLTRVSMFSKTMDCRVKPGNDRSQRALS